MIGIWNLDLKFGIWIRKGRVRGGIGLGFGIKIWNLDQKGKVRGGKDRIWSTPRHN